MYCKKCGTKQQDGHKFCPKCGTPYPVIIQEDVESVVEEHDEEDIVANKESFPQNTHPNNQQEEIAKESSLNKTKIEASYSEQQNPKVEKKNKQPEITEQEMEFARKTLTYMRRSKSDKQILLYATKFHETMEYLLGVDRKIDVNPRLFGEAIFAVEKANNTTIRNLTSEDIGLYIINNVGELVKNKEKKDWTHLASIFENSSGEEPSKTALKAKVAFYLGLVLVFGPFIINGFSFGIFWYLLIIGVAFFTFVVYGIDGKREGEAKFVKNLLVGFCIVLVMMLEWGPLDPNYSSSSSMSSNNSEYNYSGSGQNVEKTLLTCRKCHRQFYANGVIDLCENCRLRKQAHQDVMKDREEFGW